MLWKGSFNIPSDSDWHLINGLCLAESHLLVIPRRRSARRGYVALEGLSEAWTPPSPTPSRSLIPRCVKNYKLQRPNGLSGTPSTEWSCPLWSLRNTNTATGDKLEFKVTGLCLEQRPAWTESWGHRAQRQAAGGARRSVSLRPDCIVGRWCRIPFCHWQILTA